MRLSSVERTDMLRLFIYICDVITSGAKVQRLSKTASLHHMLSFSPPPRDLAMAQWASDANRKSFQSRRKSRLLTRVLKFHLFWIVITCSPNRVGVRLIELTCVACHASFLQRSRRARMHSCQVFGFRIPCETDYTVRQNSSLLQASTAYDE